MPLTDIYGVEHSTDNAASIKRYEEAVNLLLGFFNDPLEVIDQALAEDPDFVMGHCFKAGLMTTFAEKSVEADLFDSIKAAEAMAGNANDRERMHMAAARAWAEGDFTRRVSASARHLRGPAEPSRLLLSRPVALAARPHGTGPPLMA